MEINESRAKDDAIAGGGRALEGAGGVILRVRESVAAPGLEKPRQISRPARPGVAAILRRFEDGARVVAAPGHLEGGRALGHDVGRAADGPGAPVVGWPELHGHVEALQHGDVVVVLVVEGVEAVLRLGVRRRAVGLAVELPAAVAGQAGAAAAGVERAVGAGPDFGEVGAFGEAQGPCLPRVEAPPPARDGGRPDGVGALVLDGEDDCMALEDEEKNKRETDFETHFDFSMVTSIGLYLYIYTSCVVGHVQLIK
ncbi:hypothetical protein SASPL_115340 [Salvia splendens]|uniref:Uncharacterized protein n=1 Tax=Salvia splendens TaxID=180675 RepID=A0A8X9A173_SALSN|nr:hypothetical protein SASPL_115340 [Salvia splendens]